MNNLPPVIADIQIEKPSTAAAFNTTRPIFDDSKFPSSILDPPFSRAITPFTSNHNYRNVENSSLPMSDRF